MNILIDLLRKYRPWISAYIGALSRAGGEPDLLGLGNEAEDVEDAGDVGRHALDEAAVDLVLAADGLDVAVGLVHQRPDGFQDRPAERERS